MRVVVAGGAGFLGSHLVERLLNDGHEVVAIDNLLTGSNANIDLFKNHPKFNFLNKDVTEPMPDDLVTDAVFHLASPASPNHHSPISYHSLPLETMSVNTTGTFRLIALSLRNRAKFLFASTSEVYGDPLVNPQNEEYRGNVSTTGPRSVYDEAKRYGETITAHFWRGQLDGRIVRIFNTYGPRMQKADMRMIVAFINQALVNKPITVFGDGQQTRSLCYVDDTVEGLVRLMFHNNTRGEVVNIGSTQEHTVLEYAQIVKKLTNSSSEIVFSESLPLDDPKQRRADISKAKRLLDWEPQIGLEDGLRKLISFFKAQTP